MKFWDTSAIVPLLVVETQTSNCSQLQRRILPCWWWGSEVECNSALTRRESDGALDARAMTLALRRLRQLTDAWHEIDPSDAIREAAIRFNGRRLASRSGRSSVPRRSNSANGWTSGQNDKEGFRSRLGTLTGTANYTLDPRSFRHVRLPAPSTRWQLAEGLKELRFRPLNWIDRGARSYRAPPLEFIDENDGGLECGADRAKIKMSSFTICGDFIPLGVEALRPFRNRRFGPQCYRSITPCLGVELPVPAWRQIERCAVDLVVGILRRQRGVEGDRCIRVKRRVEAKPPLRNGRAAVLARIHSLPRRTFRRRAAPPDSFALAA
jgi:hypothetical protein